MLVSFHVISSSSSSLLFLYFHSNSAESDHKNRIARCIFIILRAIEAALTHLRADTFVQTTETRRTNDSMHRFWLKSNSISRFSPAAKQGESWHLLGTEPMTERRWKRPPSSEKARRETSFSLKRNSINWVAELPLIASSYQDRIALIRRVASKNSRDKFVKPKCLLFLFTFYLLVAVVSSPSFLPFSLSLFHLFFVKCC